MNVGGSEEVASAVASQPAPQEWKFSQVFGELAVGEEVQEGKILTVNLTNGEKNLLWVRIFSLVV